MQTFYGKQSRSLVVLKKKTAGAATFLVKVKVHRGEPADEEANIQADKAISSKDVPAERHDKWQEPRWTGSTVSYEIESQRGTAGPGAEGD